jgi:hypothetical protein
MAEDTGDKDNVVRLARKRRCPICGQATVQAFRPFCSQRCADQDLGRWLTGGYRIPAEEEPDLDGEPEGGA